MFREALKRAIDDVFEHLEFEVLYRPRKGTETALIAVIKEPENPYEIGDSKPAAGLQYEIQRDLQFLKFSKKSRGEFKIAAPKTINIIARRMHARTSGCVIKKRLRSLYDDFWKLSDDIRLFYLLESLFVNWHIKKVVIKREGY